MVDEANIRRETFRLIYTLINDNKITNSYVYAGFPNREPQYPMYTIHPFTVDSTSEDLGYDQSYVMETEIELFCKASDTKSKIDEMKDNIQSTILNNISTLHSNNLELVNNWFEDSNVSTIEVDNKKYHTGAVILRFKLR